MKDMSMQGTNKRLIKVGRVSRSTPGSGSTRMRLQVQAEREGKRERYPIYPRTPFAHAHSGERGI